jgi:Lipocalin-like domain
LFGALTEANLPVIRRHWEAGIVEDEAKGKEKQDTPRMAEQVGLTQLVGSWRLVSLVATYADTKERIELYGPHPTGYMVLSPNGRIIFLFTRADRTPPQTDADRATLFSAMTAYTVDLAWDPGWTGEQIRYFTLEGHRLKIRTPAQMHPQMGSQQFVGDLVWERET